MRCARHHRRTNVQGGNLVQPQQRIDREGVTARTLSLQSKLWDVAVEAAETDPRPVTSRLFLQAPNKVIDAYGRGQAALDELIRKWLSGGFNGEVMVKMHWL